MNSLERFNETLSDKKAFHSEMYLQIITDKDYTLAHIVFKELKLKNLGDYHDLCVQSVTLLLADVFENFRNKCVEMFEPDPANFLSAPQLSWNTCLKKTGVKSKLITDIDMLLMVDKEIRGGICHAIPRNAKANSKYVKNYDKNIESSYLMYLDANNLHGCAMSQRLPVNGFEWIEQLSEFDELFIKSYDENNNKRYILEVDVKYSKCLFNLHCDLPFLPERNKIEKCKKLVCNMHNKENYVGHIRSLKQALNHGFILKQVHKVIQFNEKA